MKLGERYHEAVIGRENMLMDDMDDMHERLKAARIAANFTSARSAASKHRWNPSTYLAHENGQNRFDPATANRYARAFKVDGWWLLTGNSSGPNKNAIDNEEEEQPVNVLLDRHTLVSAVETLLMAFQMPQSTAHTLALAVLRTAEPQPSGTSEIDKQNKADIAMKALVSALVPPQKK